MEVQFSSFTPRTSSLQLRLSSSNLLRLEKLFHGDLAMRSCPTGTFFMLPLRTESAITLQVFAAAKQGFGPQPKKKMKKTQRKPQMKEEKDPITRAKQILSKKQQNLTEDAGNIDVAPSLMVNEDPQNDHPLDEEVFERRLAEIKRVAEEQKLLEEQKKYGPIDYDAPLPSSQNGLANNLGAQIGVGVAVVVFGLIFALGDFLPSGKPTAEKSSLIEAKQLTEKESLKLKAQVKEFEDVLKLSPDDRTALEGVAVSYAELGEFDRAAESLSKILQKSPGDADVLRLLGEVQNGKGDYDASVTSYRAAIRASGKKESLTLLRGLTDTLLALNKPSEAVGELLAARARLKYNFTQMKSSAQQTLLPPTTGKGYVPEEFQDDENSAVQADPVTVELLLGKAYAAWAGHTGDAVSVYDGLIASYPEDYRGYLAKGVLLKSQDKRADAERMFIQARYLAPPDSKSTVDIYSGRRAS